MLDGVMDSALDSSYEDDWNSVEVVGNAGDSTPRSGSDDWNLEHNDAQHSSDAEGVGAEVVPARCPGEVAIDVAESSKHLYRQALVEAMVSAYRSEGSHMTGAVRSKLSSTCRTRMPENLRATAYLCYTALRTHVSNLILSAVKRCSRDHPHYDACQAVVYVRRRKYDEAQQMCICAVPDPIAEEDGTEHVADKLGHCDHVKAKHKLMVTQLAWGLILRKMSRHSAKYLGLVGTLASHLQSFNRNTAETVKASLQMQRLDGEDEIRSRVERIVNIHCHDEGPPNMRFERHASEHHEDHETDVEVLCLAHKKAQANTECLQVVKPVDSKLIRLQLSLSSSLAKEVLSAARILLRERVEIIELEAVTVDMDAYVKAAVDLCCSGRTGYDRYRRFILDSLWYGDWNRHGKIRIVDKLMLGRAKLLGLLCSLGLDVLFPRRAFMLLQRKNWTGADVCIDQLLLPEMVFGLFSSAYCYATNSSGIPSVGFTNSMSGLRWK